MDVEIEEMLEEHLKLITLSEFDDFWNMNILKNDLLSPNSYYIIAKNGDSILGFAGINFILDEAHIANIAVRKDKRNLKIGTKLLESLISKAKENATLITLEVNEKNLPAIKLYENFDFKTVR